MIPLFKVAMSAKASALVGQVLDSGYIGQGAKVDEFERALAERLDNSRILTVSSATAGLHLALHLVATESGRDGEVLATALTCTATNWPILANGMRIRWVDTDPATLNLDLDDLAKKDHTHDPGDRPGALGRLPGHLDRLSRVLDQADVSMASGPGSSRTAPTHGAPPTRTSRSAGTATSASTASRRSSTSRPVTVD